MPYKEQLIKVLAKCLNNYKTVEGVVNELFELVSSPDCTDIAYPVFGKITKYSSEDILAKLLEKIDTTTEIDVLLNVIDFANCNGTSIAFSLLLKAVEISFEYENQPDRIRDVISLIGKFNPTIINQRKKDLSEILYLGFHTTTSEMVKKEILTLVAEKKLKTQFRLLLKDDEDRDYYKRWSK